MIRLFTRHYRRKTYALDGMWKFLKDPEKAVLPREWNAELPCNAEDIPVPSCWNNMLGARNYDGLAWFFRKFTTESKNVNLVFHGVSGQAEVYLDGNHLGSHYGSFTDFSFLVRGLAAGEHVLAVSADNTGDDMNTIPLSRLDWHNYGGITRSVEIMELDNVWIRDCRIDYLLDDAMKSAAVTLALSVEGLDGDIHNEKLRIFLDNECIYTGNIPVRGKTTVKIPEIFIDGIQLWSVENPKLYLVRVETEKDDILERIGFRKIEAGNGKILLNGSEIRLKGVNRHEDHPDWGSSIPLTIMQRDIKIIKHLGCNSIRGAHYPNAELFLDFCDQEGILFWEEIPVWQYYEKQLRNPPVRERGVGMLEEMIKRDYHHPSIILWGIHNEIDVRIQAGYELTKVFADKVRSLDASRLVTYACSMPMEDICFPLVDVIGINKYFEWYEGVKEDWPAFLKAFKSKLSSDGLGDKPLIVSEFGVEALYGESGFEPDKWTEDYQEKYLEYVLQVLLKDCAVSGMYIWQYCDVLTANYIDRSLLRPRGYNNKGLVNEYRKPKRAYWKVRDIYINH